jgi:hypothetical protein
MNSMGREYMYLCEGKGEGGNEFKKRNLLGLNVHLAH